MNWLPYWNHPAMMWAAIAVGACVGSFLNVVIYRVPRDLSVNEPKRSFCPSCKATLPWWQNLPVITWIIQRGKCAHCGAGIAPRYLLVEVLTAALFFCAWWLFSPLAGFLMMVMFAVLVAVAFIDAEHYIIPITLTTGAAVLATACSFFQPETLDLAKEGLLGSWVKGFAASAIGYAAGFCGLLLMVLLGKLMFGTKKLRFEKAAAWELVEPTSDDEQLRFVLKDDDGKITDEYGWGDLFFRNTDALHLTGHGILIDGKRTRATELEIRDDHIKYDGKTLAIENLKSLSGKATAIDIPREAMGMGDPHLLGMIGAFVGWPGVLFTVLASCFYAIIAAVIARVSFGRPLPYGPFLALGAVTWILGGWQWWQAYFSYLQEATGR